MSSAGSTAMPESPTRAVLVTSRQGSTVVFIPGNDPSKPMMLVTQGSSEHECARCEADIAKYFSTGELASKCPVCGATRTPLVLPPPNIGHN